MKKKMVLMVGLPRSGKTTIAKELIKHVDAAIVSPDAIRLSIHGQSFRAESENLVWAIAHHMVDSLFLSGHSTVIIDACNISRKRRAEWLKPGLEFYAIELTTPTAVCLDRCEDPHLEEVVERMSSHYEPPSMEEGLTFWTFANTDPNGPDEWLGARQGEIVRELTTTVRTDIQ